MQLVDHMPGAEVAEDPLLLVGQHVEDADRRFGELAGEVAAAPAGLPEGASIQFSDDIDILEGHRPQQ